MALHLKGKYWWTDFQSNGKHVQLSTKTSDRAEAEKIQELLRGRKIQSYKREDKDPGVYFLKAPALGLVKIGCSGDAGKRIDDLKNMNADDLILVAKIVTNQYRTAESVIHDFFVAQHVRREWYRISDEDVDFAVRYWDRIKDAENILARHEALPIDRERYYTLVEVADMLDMSVAFVRKIIRNGELDKVKIGGFVRVTGTDFQDYIRRCRLAGVVKSAVITPDSGSVSIQGSENATA